MECEQCGAVLVGGSSRRRFCTPRCRQRHHRATVGPSERLSEGRWVRCVGKRPVTVSGRPASSTDPSTWSSWPEVQSSTAGDGFGVMLGGGLACHDLDHALDGGELKPWAREVLDGIRERVLFAEVSVSGEGLHLFVEAPEGPGHRRAVGDGGHEFYSRARFIRVTGDRWERPLV
ncbi:bifunctional DNA primase/polymerase [Corynebacterium nuruki]|uniref:bifunctional DNA primase/polymerase n=1 Tax=Corynebacterium nuruki TaxID=1032851 RepID=UPI0039BEDDBD